MEREPWKIDQVCSDIHINKIAKLIESWEGLSASFGISRPEVVEIQKDYSTDYGQQKREFLFKWRRKNGNEATLRKLLNCLREAGENPALLMNELKMGVDQVGSNTPTNQFSAMVGQFYRSRVLFCRYVI